MNKLANPLMTGVVSRIFAELLVPAWILSANLGPAYSAPAEAPRQQLKGHLSAEMLAAPILRPVPPTTQLTLTVGLAIRNMDALAKTAEEVSDPDSASYRKFLTPAQVADQFGATPADYQALLDWARANHFTVTAHKNRFVATVAGSVANIESALKVHMDYRQRADGSEFYAPDAEPTIEIGPAVEHIGGLDNFVLPRRAGGSAGGAYQGSDFRNAYAPNMTVRGAGQSIGIFMSDGFAQSDVNGFAKMTNSTYLPIQEVPANTTGTPGIEGALDIDMALSMAPRAQIVVFLGNDTAILTNMTDRPDIKQLTSSWFWYDGTTTDEHLMNVLASQGQSFFQASGDGGPYPAGWPNAAKYSSPNLDCRQFPNITIVGGTSLNMSDNGASYGAPETAWPDSSGGSLVSVPIPPYQEGVAGHLGASPANRNVPDVSAQAAGGNIFFNGSPTNVGGTSQATPLWAGFMALVNELAAQYGTKSVGFANPALYKIARTSAYGSNFHDVVSGCTSSNYLLCAGPGYDLATGLGSPQHALIYALAGASVFPLYCQGPLKTSAGGSPLTPFKWAKQGAGAASPGPSECAWADGPPRGTEIQAGNGNVIAGTLNEVANLPANKYAEIGVFNNGHQMVSTQIVGFVKPPFSSNPVLP